MRRRHKMGRNHSRRMFTKFARRTHKHNVHSMPVRGGFRL
jgi:hypothetical protein